jgi:hypothetical protein
MADEIVTLHAGATLRWFNNNTKFDLTLTDPACVIKMWPTNLVIVMGNMGHDGKSEDTGCNGCDAGVATIGYNSKTKWAFALKSGVITESIDDVAPDIDVAHPLAGGTNAVVDKTKPVQLPDQEYIPTSTYTDSTGHKHLLPADFYKNFVGHPAIVSEVIEHVYGGFIH